MAFSGQTSGGHSSGSEKSLRRRQERLHSRDSFKLVITNFSRQLCSLEEKLEEKLNSVLQTVEKIVVVHVQPSISDCVAVGIKEGVVQKSAVTSGSACGSSTNATSACFDVGFDNKSESTDIERTWSTNGISRLCQSQ